MAKVMKMQIPIRKAAAAHAVTTSQTGKVRNGFILLHGADVPDALIDEISTLVGKRLNDEPTEFMVSGADADCYDYFDAECE
jgi:hypothetical protein